jgi:hypothetical protein
MQDRSLQNSRLPIEECMCRQWYGFYFIYTKVLKAKFKSLFAACDFCRQGPQELMAEIQRLWKEISGYKIELAKAEVLATNPISYSSYIIFFHFFYLYILNFMVVQLLKARNMVTSSPPAAKKVAIRNILKVMFMLRNY